MGNGAPPRCPWYLPSAALDDPQLVRGSGGCAQSPPPRTGRGLVWTDSDADGLVRDAGKGGVACRAPEPTKAKGWRAAPGTAVLRRSPRRRDRCGGDCIRVHRRVGTGAGRIPGGGGQSHRSAHAQGRSLPRLVSRGGARSSVRGSEASPGPVGMADRIGSTHANEVVH